MVKKQSGSRSRSRSRRQSKRRQQSRRRQRGGDASLEQGATFQRVHVNQHGGFRDALVGAPIEYSGVLESNMRGAAGLEKYDAHFSQAQAHGQSGGSRRRRRSQRGGSLSPAAVGQSYTLLDSYAGAGVPPPHATGPQVPYTVIGGDHGAPAPMKGGRRKNKNNKSRKNKSSRKNNKSHKNNKSRSRSRKNQRGGFAPVGQASMLLEDYSKAGLPSFKAI